MAQVTLDIEAALRIINKPDSDADSRMIAAYTIAFFESAKNADVIEKSTRSIVLKLGHMAASEIYKGAE